MSVLLSLEMVSLEMQDLALLCIRTSRESTVHALIAFPHISLKHRDYAGQTLTTTGGVRHTVSVQ